MIKLKRITEIWVNAYYYIYNYVDIFFNSKFNDRWKEVDHNIQLGTKIGEQQNTSNFTNTIMLAIQFIFFYSFYCFFKHLILNNQIATLDYILIGVLTSLIHIFFSIKKQPYIEKINYLDSEGRKKSSMCAVFFIIFLILCSVIFIYLDVVIL